MQEVDGTRERHLGLFGTSEVARCRFLSMAENPLSSSRFWQVWALLGCVGTALAGARLLYPAGVTSARLTQTQANARPKSRTTQPVVEGAPTTVPSVDRLFARLAVAATASERCSLLEQFQPSEDTQATYAITALLERAQLGSVRACATQALSRQPTVEARSWLLELAEDPEPEVHRGALDELATRDDAARAVVLEAAHSDDLEMSVSAVQALLKAKRTEGFAAAARVLPLIEDADTLSALIDALGESHDPQALPVLEGLLERTGRESHLRAISAVGELGVASAAERISAFLQVGSNEEFGAAAEALKKLTPERIGDQLRAVLASANEQRQELALSALLSLDLPDLSSIMRQQLEVGDRTRAYLVLRHLITAPDTALEAEIIAVARDDQRRLLLPAVQALSKLDTPSARAAIQRLSKELPESVALQFGLPEGAEDRAREIRIATLATATGVPHGALYALVQDPAKSAQDAVLGYLAGHEVPAEVWASVAESAPASTVRALVDRRESYSLSAKDGLLQGLGRRGDPQFAATLHEDLRGAATRNSALTALAQLGDEAVFPELQRLAKSDDSADRNLAVELLSARSDPESTLELEQLASDPEAEIVSGALRALQTRSPELVARAAERALRETAAGDRASLLSSLSDLSPHLSRPLLERSLNDADDSVAVQAIQSLGDLQGPAVAQRLLAVVTDANRSEEVRKEAANGLRTLGGPLARANSALLDSLLGTEEVYWSCTPN